MIKFNHSGYTYENQALQHGTYHQHPVRSRGWHADQGTLPQVRRHRGATTKKELESETNRLKKLVADQALDIQMLKEINSTKW